MQVRIRVGIGYLLCNSDTWQPFLLSRKESLSFRAKVPGTWRVPCTRYGTGITDDARSVFVLEGHLCTQA